MIKKNFTLSVANKREGEFTNFSNVRKVSSIQELAECLKFDHVAGTLKNNYRVEKNLIGVNCFIMDMDNDSDNPADWKTPEYISEKLPDVEYYTCYSRNHLKQKKDKSPRPRFHVYLPFTRELSDPREICRYKEKILSVIPELDACAKDAVRLIFGVENPEILHFDGDVDILDFLDKLPSNEPQIFFDSQQAVVDKNDSQPIVEPKPNTDSKQDFIKIGEDIPAGKRNDTLHKHGINYIAFYDTIEKAKAALWRDNQEHCKPPISESELREIWESILNSDTRRLVDLAKKINDREKFLSEAKKVSKQDKAIEMVARCVFELKDKPTVTITEKQARLYACLFFHLIHEDIDTARENYLDDCKKLQSTFNENMFNQAVKRFQDNDIQDLIALARTLDEKEKFLMEAKAKTDNEKLISYIAEGFYENPTPRYEAIFSLAEAMLIKYSKVNNAHDFFLKTVPDTYTEAEKELAWNAALKSFRVKLANFAKSMSEDKEAYMSLALTVTDNITVIHDIWQRINGKKKSDAFGFKPEKKPVTAHDVENALKTLGITIKLDVIAYETVIDIQDKPENKKYLISNFSELSETAKQNVAKISLPGILVPYLRDNNFSTNYNEIQAFIDTIATGNPFNPIKEMFLEKPHDGRDRFKELLQIMHIQEDSFDAMLVKKWLIQACALACNDDGKLSQEFLLILRGRQGIGKSEFFRCLAMNPEWFCSGKSLNMDNKDSIIGTTTVWLAELGEFDDVERREQSVRKAHFSESFDRYRLPYARREIKKPRRTCYGGSVNEMKFIRDSTGSRRYGIIDATQIDSEIMRNLPREWYQQLWRQFYDIFLNDSKAYRFSLEEKNMLEQRNLSATVELAGETEIYDLLDWCAPVNQWTYYTPTMLRDKMQEHYLTAAQLGKALRKIALNDNRVINKRLNYGSVYLLPPLRAVNSINEAEIIAANADIVVYENITESSQQLEIVTPVEAITPKKQVTVREFVQALSEAGVNGEVVKYQKLEKVQKE